MPFYFFLCHIQFFSKLFIKTTLFPHFPPLYLVSKLHLFHFSAWRNWSTQWFADCHQKRTCSNSCSYRKLTFNTYPSPAVSQSPETFTNFDSGLFQWSGKWTQTQLLPLKLFPVPVCRFQFSQTSIMNQLALHESRRVQIYPRSEAEGGGGGNANFQ